MLCRPTLLFFESHHPCGSSKDVRVSFSFSVMEHSYALAAADVGINNKPLVWEASCLPSAKSRFTLRLAEQAMVLHTWRHLFLLLRHHARNKIRWHREHAWALRERICWSVSTRGKCPRASRFAQVLRVVLISELRRGASSRSGATRNVHQVWLP